MGLHLKMDKPIFFDKVGVDSKLVSKFLDMGYTVSLGFFEMKILDANGSLASKLTFTDSTSNIMKNKTSADALAVIRKMITDALTTLVADDSAVVMANQDDGDDGEDEPAPAAASAAATPDYDAALDGAVKPAVGIAPAGMTISQIKKMAPVALKDAKLMYQPVRGTYAGSVYNVVAMNQRVKVAIRLANNEVSVRVEGELTPNIVSAFGAVAITNKGQYLSGHFTLSGKVTADRLVGALLMGSGLEFHTQMPTLSHLK